MSGQNRGSPTAPDGGGWHHLAVMLAFAALISGCKHQGKSTKNSTGSPPPAVVAATRELAAQLATARVDQARLKLEERQPGEALALLVSALRADPSSTEARIQAAKILTETIWNFPTLTIPHSQPIEQLAIAAPGSLWVSLGGPANTTLRWDLGQQQISSVLFPVTGVPTRCLVFGPDDRSVIIERGAVTLLCNAVTLKPIRDLGPLPEFVTPTATIAFSPDGLLVAHPAFVSATDKSLVWQLRDVATGQILRTSDPVPPDAPRPLAAYLDRGKLRVLHADGSLMEMPVSPVEAMQTIPIPEPVALLDAQFSRDGNAALTLVSQGPHQAPVQSIISYQNKEDGSLELKPLTERFPWNRQPNIWNGLMRDPATAPFEVTDHSLKILTSPHAPLETVSVITAAAFEGDRVITGEQNGNVIVHRLLPLPARSDAALPATPVTATGLTALENLSEALSGTRHDDAARDFPQLDPAGRIAAFESCDLTAIQEVFPALDFSKIQKEFGTLTFGSPAPAAFLPLWDRLARADLTRRSWPDILLRSAALVGTPWHDQLAAALRGEGDPASPWLAGERMETIFQTDDNEAVLAAIREAGNKGPAAAAALSLSLRSGHPEWINACLESAVDLPPFLRLIAESRSAWLLGQRSKALSPWPESFPEMAEIRQSQDWEGWELADFKPALESIRQSVQDELGAIEVPEKSTEEQRKAVADRLADPETLATVGRSRYALACMKAALAFSAHKEQSETTFELASTARDMGAPPEPCLRAEALALTAMGDYQKAHPRWIELITEHPLETQIPGDYAEAAYTAFENADPQQAMTILTTGMHRYPQDGNFALRAGWVALLTGNSERGYQFLQAGKRIGFPEEKLENATALLTIAAAQNGDYDDATVYFNDLVRIDPAWAELKTLDTLDWPDELKSVLGQFMH